MSNNEGAAAGVGAESTFKKYNDLHNKKDVMKAFREAAHEKAVQRLLRQCHKDWAHGDYELVASNGPKVGRRVVKDAPVTLFDVGHQRWLHAKVHRVLHSRREGTVDALAAVGPDGTVYVCPLQTCVQGHVELAGAAHDEN